MSSLFSLSLNYRKSCAFAGHKTSRLQGLQRGGGGCIMSSASADICIKTPA